MPKPLRKKLRDVDCKRCSLHEEAHNVCLIGEGPYPTEIMVIGKAPDYREDQTGRLLSGKAGKQILRPALEKFDIDTEEVFFSNAIHCNPPKGKKLNKKEMEACSHFLFKEMEYVKPRKIIAMGANVLKVLLGKYSASLKNYTGKTILLEKPWGKVEVLVTYLPAFILEKPAMKKYFHLHLKNFLKPRKRTGTQVYPWHEKYFLNEWKGDVSIDIETNTLNPHEKDAEILSIAATPKKGKGYWMDIREKYSDFVSLNSILQNKEALIIGHNLKFDLKFLIVKGILGGGILKSDRLYDTLIAFNTLDENCLDKGLKSLSYNHTSMVEYGMPEDLGDDLEEMYEYNCMDVDATKRLKNWTLKQLKKEPELLVPFKIDMRTTAVITSMEVKGIAIDKKALKKMKRKLGKRLDELEQVIPVENVRSPQQLTAMLVKKGFKLPKTKKGAYSATKEVLQGLVSQARTPKKKKIIESVLTYRKYHKLFSSFVIGIEDRLITKAYSLDKSREESRVFPKYHVAKRGDFKDSSDDEEGGTVTGRLSCSDPNFQQLPRDKGDLEPKFNPRRLVIPHYPYEIILSADFSQIEMFLAGIIHNEGKLIQMYADGEDMHEMTAAEVLGKKPENVTKDERKAAKTINFGIIYGITEVGLGKRLGWPTHQAKRFITKYLRAFPDMKVSIEELKHQAITKGYVENYFHRRRRLPEASESTYEGQEMLRQAINSPVQGTGADLLKICMWEIFKRLKPNYAQLIGNVHDEVVIESMNHYKQETIELVSSVYAKPPLEEYGLEPFPVPLRGEIEIGKNWFALKEKVVF